MGNKQTKELEIAAIKGQYETESGTLKKQYETQIEALRRKTKELEAELTERAETLELGSSQLKEQRALVESKEILIAEINKMLQEKTREIEELSRALEAKGAKMKDALAIGAQKDGIIDEHVQTIERLGAQISSLKNGPIIIPNYDNFKQMLESYCKLMRTEIDNLEEVIEGIDAQKEQTAEELLYALLHCQHGHVNYKRILREDVKAKIADIVQRRQKIRTELIERMQEKLDKQGELLSSIELIRSQLVSFSSYVSFFRLSLQILPGQSHSHSSSQENVGVLSRSGSTSSVRSSSSTPIPTIQDEVSRVKNVIRALQSEQEMEHRLVKEIAYYQEKLCNYKEWRIYLHKIEIDIDETLNDTESKERDLEGAQAELKRIQEELAQLETIIFHKKPAIKNASRISLSRAPTPSSMSHSMSSFDDAMNSQSAQPVPSLPLDNILSSPRDHTSSAFSTPRALIDSPHQLRFQQLQQQLQQIQQQQQQQQQAREQEQEERDDDSQSDSDSESTTTTTSASDTTSTSQPAASPKVSPHKQLQPNPDLELIQLVQSPRLIAPIQMAEQHARSQSHLPSLTYNRSPSSSRIPPVMRSKSSAFDFPIQSSEE